MPLLLPHGIISEPVMNLRTMLAKCAAFQEWVAQGVNDFPADAEVAIEYCKNFVFVGSVPRGAIKGRHLSVAVFPVPRIVATSDTTKSNGSEFDDGGQLMMAITRRVPSTYLPLDKPDDEESLNTANALLDFSGYEDEDGGVHGLGAIWDQLMELQDTGDNLVLAGMQIVDGPGFSPEEQRGEIRPWIGCTLVVQWGMQP